MRCGAIDNYAGNISPISIDEILSASGINKSDISPIGGIVAHAGIYGIFRRTSAENEEYFQINRCDKPRGCGFDYTHIADIPEDEVNIYDTDGSGKFPTALALALYKYSEKVRKCHIIK